MEATGDSVPDVRERARELFAKGDFHACYDLAVEALLADGDDVEALRLAGRAGVEMGAPGAIDHLRRVTELRPDDVDAWRDLGDALAADGRTSAAEEAWTRAAALRPGDSTLLTALGHAALAAGLTDEAATRLRRAAEAEPRNQSATFSLVDVYRDAHKPEEALAVARQAWEAYPDDALAGLDVAELSLAVGALDAAEEAYERLREIEDEAREVYVRYGQLEVALRREDWTRGSELAAAAVHADQSPRNTRLLVFFADRAFGSLDRSATTPEIGAAIVASQSGVFALPALPEPQDVPEASEVERLLAEGRAEHRRIHVEERALHDVGAD